MSLDMMISYALTLCLGVVFGAAILWTIQRIKLKHFKQLSMDLIKKAEMECDALKKEAQLTLRQQQLENQKEYEQRLQNDRKRMCQEDERLKQKEDKLENRISLAEKKLTDIEKRETQLIAQKVEMDQQSKLLMEKQDSLLNQLETVAGYTAREAKTHIIDQITNELKSDSANLIKRTLNETSEHAEQEASKILATAINRLSVKCTSEATINTVFIPNEEMKGKIIGREGRNIRALEQATGINFIIDETPGAVILSGFDPIRMQIAKMVLTELMQDGRIHPTRIEEAVQKAKIDVQKLIKKYGEDAALRVGAINLHPELITLLGKLKFRFSFGQNILDHSLEVAHLMGVMAAELGLDSRMAKRIGLLHDMGKAVTHEMEGSHAMIGYELALRYGESKEVANGIGCHHGEIEALTIEGSLCNAADTISSSRQGARSEPVDEYIKRLKRLEDLACEFSGVEKAYALQAGREVRVIVLPDEVDDEGTVHLARNLTKRIEQELKYPGKIKITVIREKRIVEYAM